MTTPILRITDGTQEGTVDLLNIRGWLLKEWNPSVAEPKGGGIFRSSPLIDGRKLAYRKMDNITDTFNLVGSDGDQNGMIASIRKLQSILEKATEYWTSGFQNEPVWIEAKGPLESGTRYAVIDDYRLSGFGSPYQQPFFNCQNSATEAILIIEHGFWQDTVPGERGHCVELQSRTDYTSVKYYDSGTFYPNHPLADVTYSDKLKACDTMHPTLGIGYCASYPGNCSAGIIFENANIPIGAVIIRAALRVKLAYMTAETKVLVSGQSQTYGGINSVTLVSKGCNYHFPLVQIYDDYSGEGGTGAVVVASVELVPAGQCNGAIYRIKELSIVEPGFGYHNPKLLISDSGCAPHNCGYGATGTCTAELTGVDAALFTGSNSDFLHRGRTERSEMHTFGMTIATLVDIPITYIVREITTNDSWASGDNIGIFMDLIKNEGPSIIRPGIEIASYDNGMDYPLLIVDWMAFAAPEGRDTTCAQEVYVSNKHNLAPVDYIFCNDVSAGTFSPNMFEHDFSSLLPMFQDGVGNVITPAVGDATYFGSCPAGGLDVDYGVFCSLVFDFFSGQVGMEGEWEYYNGGVAESGWHIFDDADLNYLCSDNANWQFTGVKSVVWSQPTDWIKTTINGNYGYWVRFHVHTAVGAVSPYQQHRDIYTVINPYIDIEGDRVPGDIPALAKINFDSAACSDRSMNTLVLGLRSLSRGEDFDAYLNVSDIQNADGIMFKVEDAYIGALTDSTVTPTGRLMLMNGFNPATHMAVPDFSPICSWSMRGDLAKQYIGTFHAYARGEFPLGAVGSARLRLRSVFGDEFNVNYSESNSVSLGIHVCCIDLGQLTISPSNTLHRDDVIGDMKIYLDGYSEDGTDWLNAYVSDIILIPADEWSGNFGMPKITGTSVLTYGYGVEVDGITTPRQYRAAEVHKLDSGKLFVADWSRIASSEPIFQSNSDQRLWFLQYKHQAGLVSYLENCGTICIERSSRYILMRGSG